MAITIIMKVPKIVKKKVSKINLIIKKEFVLFIIFYSPNLINLNFEVNSSNLNYSLTRYLNQVVDIIEMIVKD